MCILGWNVECEMYATVHQHPTALHLPILVIHVKCGLQNVHWIVVHHCALQMGIISGCATFVFSQTVSPVHFNRMHCSAALWCSLHSSLWQFKGCKVKFGQLATRNSWSCCHNIIVVSRSNQIKLATSWEDAKWSLSSWPLETADAADPAVTTPTLLLMTVDQICTGQKWHL